MNTAEAMKKGVPLPQPICFAPKEVNFEYSKAKEPLKVMEERSSESKVVDKILEGQSTQFTCNGLALFNKEGGWMKMSSPFKGWVLLQPAKFSHKGDLKVVSGSKDPNTWLKVVEKMCSLQIVKVKQIANCDEEESRQLQTPPPGWSMEADEELAQYLVKYLDSSPSSMGGAPGTSQLYSFAIHDHNFTCLGGEFISRVELSSNEDQVQALLSHNTESECWESDGSTGQHWIRFHMKPG